MHPDKRNEFDTQLAGKFQNFQPEVPGGLWDKIASKLDEQEQSNTVPIKQPRRFPSSWVSAAAAVLLVCGAVYWYNRPVTVTYLQRPVVVVHADETVTPVAEGPSDQEADPEIEPLDIDRLKQLFTRRDRKVERKNLAEIRVAETKDVGQPTETTDSLLSAIDEMTSPAPALAKNDSPVIPPSEDHQMVLETVATTVPEIEPPVALEEAAETLLAASDRPKQPFGVSNILNYVVGTVDQREEKLVTFSNDGEGSLKLDFNFSLARNKKSSIK